MSENFAEMLANEEWKEIHTGEVVDGTVIAVKEDHIVLRLTLNNLRLVSFQFIFYRLLS